MRHGAARVYTSIIHCVVKCKNRVGQQATLAQAGDEIYWLYVWLPQKQKGNFTFISHSHTTFPLLIHNPEKLFFFSLNPFQSFRRRGAKSIIFWIYVLHLSVHGRRLLCQLCGQCVIRLQVEHLTGHTSVPVNIAVLSLIISIHSNIAGTEMHLLTYIHDDKWAEADKKVCKSSWKCVFV